MLRNLISNYNLIVSLLLPQAVDTAIVKLYAELDAAGLENFLSSYATLTMGEASRIQCDREDCLKWLERERRFHARALLLVFLSNDIAAAADTWHKLVIHITCVLYFLVSRLMLFILLGLVSIRWCVDC